MFASFSLAGRPHNFNPTFTYFFLPRFDGNDSFILVSDSNLGSIFGFYPHHDYAFNSCDYCRTKHTLSKSFESQNETLGQETVH